MSEGRGGGGSAIIFMGMNVETWYLTDWHKPEMAATVSTPLTNKYWNHTQQMIRYIKPLHPRPTGSPENHGRNRLRSTWEVRGSEPCRTWRDERDGPRPAWRYMFFLMLLLEARRGRGAGIRLPKGTRLRATSKSLEKIWEEEEERARFKQTPEGTSEIIKTNRVQKNRKVERKSVLLKTLLCGLINICWVSLIKQLRL